MGRKRPLCALCGKSLVSGKTAYGTIQVDYEGKPGKPAVGWHIAPKGKDGSCFFRDPLGKKLLNGGDIDSVPPWSVENMLKQIAERGRERVVRNRK